MERFDEKRLELSLQHLLPWRRIAFMVKVGERMLPNYERFSAEAGFGDVSVLKDAFNAALTWIESDRLPDNLADLRRSCEQQAPDTERFDSRYTSAALDAANVASIILDAIERPDEARPLDVASLARDTVDMFVQGLLNLNPNASEFEETILRHPLMQTELRRQKEDLNALMSSHEDREMMSRDLRASFAGRTQSSLEE
jgi:uncharacterized protein YjaG (DUF416 family)